MKRIYSCIICANELKTATSRYCPECRPFIYALRRNVRQAMYYADLPPIAGDCVDCGAKAMHYDHRYYSLPLEVDPVCRYCNQKRGQALDVVELIRKMRGIEPKLNLCGLAPTLQPKPKHAALMPSTGAVLDDARRDVIVAALTRNKHNMAAAARELGITYRSIRHYVNKWSLQEVSNTITADSSTIDEVKDK